MFHVDDVVIYGCQGVCKVAKIGSLNLSVADKTRQYYTLHPLYQPEMIIYAPVDGAQIVVRTPITKEQAEELVSEIPEIEPVWVENEREREAMYRAALNTCDCRELIKIIKALYLRKEARIQNGKRGTALDEKYFHLAETQFYGELAFALGVGRDQVTDYIKNNMAEAV